MKIGERVHENIYLQNPKLNENEMFIQKEDDIEREIEKKNLITIYTSKKCSFHTG